MPGSASRPSPPRRAPAAADPARQVFEREARKAAHTTPATPNRISPPTTTMTAPADPNSRSPIVPATSPAKSSIGAHTRAEVILANQNRPRGIRMMPAASGMTARIGPKKRPMNTLLPPCRSKNRMPLGKSAGLRLNGHSRATLPPSRRPIQ